jgi:hypothetical protein
VLDAMSQLLQKRIIIKEWEKDMVFMQNEFEIRTKNQTVINKKYDMIVFGGHNNLHYTATALLVGIPAGITTQVTGYFKNSYSWMIKYKKEVYYYLPQI